MLWILIRLARRSIYVVKWCVLVDIWKLRLWVDVESRGADWTLRTGPQG